MADLIIFEKVDKYIGRLFFNQPDELNAMTDKMAGEFSRQVSLVQADKELRVLLLSGKGRAFSAGGHLSMLEQKIKLSAEQNRIGMDWFYRSFLSIRNIEIPTIAALNGHAIGAALGVALACDIRLANERAKLGVNFVRLGLHPGMGVTHTLTRLVGPARAAELFYTGAIITAAQAAEYGLVNHVYPETEFETRSLEFATTIAKASPEAIRELKCSLRSGATETLDGALLREAECQARSYASKDFAKGLAAIQAKQESVF